jgi:hypothetical protein
MQIVLNVQLLAVINVVLISFWHLLLTVKYVHMPSKGVLLV